MSAPHRSHERQLPAEWVDPSGVREEATFLDKGIFAFIHMPVGKLVGGLLICPPMGIAFRRNYRREVLLARSLANRGIAVQRFHYRGTGSSLGSAQDVTFERMREDAMLAATHLADRVMGGRLGFLGTRLGSLVAASAAAQFGRSPLALWEPVTQGHLYFEEASRVAAIQQLRRGAGGPRLSLAKEIERTGSADILGHRVHEPLYRSLLGRSLTEDAGSQPGGVLLIRPSSKGSRGDPFARPVEEWRDRGVPVEVRHIDQGERWWFSDPRELTDEAKESSGVLVDVTAGWIERRVRQNG